MAVVDVKEHYNKAAQNRDERLRTGALNVWQFNHRLREKIIRNFIKSCGRLNNGIDIGTGTGVWAEILAEYCSVVEGIDFAEENIRIASKNAHAIGLDDRLTYRISDVQTLDGISDNKYDIAIQISVLQHLLDKKLSLRRIQEILAKNGYFIILVHNSNCFYNRNLNIKKRLRFELSLNEYISIFDIINTLNDVGFEILKVRYTWFFLNDFIFWGATRRVLKPFFFIRYILVFFSIMIDKIFGRFLKADFLFREIVIFAKKKP